MFVKQYNSSYYFVFNWTPLYVLLYNTKTFIYQSVHIFLGATVSVYQPSTSLFPTLNLCLDRGNLRTYSDWADLLKPLSSSLVPSMVPSAWSCKWKPCRLYSFVTIPFSWGSAKRQKVEREREWEKDRVKQALHSESVRGFKAPGLARAFHGLQIWACITNKRSDHSDRRTGTKIYIYLHVGIVPRVTTQKID